eukprot:m.290624 g.290624  ORF g.290624 m.290624 type:complete len:377 (-) comp12333_c0_seq1:169-1299(-)
MVEVTFRMATPRKRVGVLTSGGDCPGLNAVIRAVVMQAHSLGWEVVGIQGAIQGLLSRPPMVEVLEPRFAGSILRLGGTILRTTNKGDPYRYPMPDGSFKDRTEEIHEGYKLAGLDGIIGIGGDGSQRLMLRLTSQFNIPYIGVPKTIDNDLAGTRWAVGYSTAVDTCMEALDRLHSTAESHSRVLILEVMGRDAGHIAIAAGIAGGADVILVPEIPFDLDCVIQKLRKVKERGDNHALIVCAEGVRVDDAQVQYYTAAGKPVKFGVSEVLRAKIDKETGFDSRVTILGHVQRGGAPNAFDRTLAAGFGVRAMQLLADGETGRLVCYRSGHIHDVEINAESTKTAPLEPDSDLVKTARGLGICLGDRCDSNSACAK